MSTIFKKKQAHSEKNTACEIGDGYTTFDLAFVKFVTVGWVGCNLRKHGDPFKCFVCIYFILFYFLEITLLLLMLFLHQSPSQIKF